jgi:hypothetical protein
MVIVWWVCNQRYKDKTGEPLQPTGRTIDIGNASMAARTLEHTLIHAMH